MSPERCRFPTRGHVPQHHRFVPTPSRQGLAVRTEGRGLNAVRVSVESCSLLAGDYVPQPYGVVGTSRRQSLSIWTDYHSLHKTSVAIELDIARARTAPQGIGGSGCWDGKSVGDGATRAAAVHPPWGEDQQQTAHQTQTDGGQEKDFAGAHLPSVALGNPALRGFDSVVIIGHPT